MRAPLHMCITALLMSLAFSLGLYGQTGEEELVFHFRLKETTLDTAYLDNRASLARLRSHIASVEFIDSICVSVSSSPEGSFQFNARLAAERAAQTRQFLQELSSGALTDERIRITVIDEDWHGLAEMIQERYEGRDKDKIISIINAEGISDATREWRLNRIDNGRTWKLLKTEYCRYLRKSSVMRICSSVPEVKAPRRDYLVARTPDIYAATEARISSAVPGATPMDIEEPK